MLEVTQAADTRQIQMSYRRLILANHPDKHSTGTDGQKRAAIEATKKITTAWEILRDEIFRRAFDQGGHGAVHSAMKASFVYDPDPPNDDEEEDN